MTNVLFIILNHSYVPQIEGQPETRANVATGALPSTEGQQISETNSFGRRRRRTGITNGKALNQTSLQNRYFKFI